jgi:predicted dehydrogenase
MRLAFVGCGYVADLYMKTLREYRALDLAGVVDRDRARAERFASHYGVRKYDSLDELLGDRSVDTVLNLTNPRSHYDVTAACLRAGKHVYSEKPLAMTAREASELVEIAKSAGRYLSAAPSRLLGEPAQTMWKTLRSGRIGKPRLVYAELDDGLVHKMDHEQWLGASGAAWPFREEMEMGCTLEHAGYALTWLAAFFGPARTVTAFSTSIASDRAVGDLTPNALGPDFSVACIRYATDVVARVTCSTIAPENHSISIFGETGMLRVEDCWKPQTAIVLEQHVVQDKWDYDPSRENIPLLRDPGLPEASRRTKKVDFCLGPLELDAAIREKRPCRLSAEFSAHIAETVLAINAAREGSGPIELTTTFPPIAPMPWAA